MKNLLFTATALLALNIGTVNAQAQAVASLSTNTGNYSPNVDDNFPQSVYFGDTLNGSKRHD